MSKQKTPFRDNSTQKRNQRTRREFVQTYYDSSSPNDGLLEPLQRPLPESNAKHIEDETPVVPDIRAYVDTLSTMMPDLYHELCNIGLRIPMNKYKIMVLRIYITERTRIFIPVQLRATHTDYYKAIVIDNSEMHQGFRLKITGIKSEAAQSEQMKNLREFMQSLINRYLAYGIQEKISNYKWIQNGDRLDVCMCPDCYMICYKEDRFCTYQAWCTEERERDPKCFKCHKFDEFE